MMVHIIVVRNSITTFGNLNSAIADNIESITIFAFSNDVFTTFECDL